MPDSSALPNLLPQRKATLHAILANLRGRLRRAWLQLLIIAVVLSTGLSDQLVSGKQIVLGTEAAQRDIEHFWLPEHNATDSFRWTDGNGIIWLKPYTNAASLQVHMRLAGPASADQTPLPLTLRADENTMSVVPVTAQWRTYHVLVAPVGTLWHTPNLELLSPVMRAGTHDLRKLGVVVSTVTIEPLGEQLLLPRLLRAIYLATLVLLLRLWAQVLLPIRIAQLISLLLGLVVALFWRNDPAGIDQMLPAPWYLALATSGIGILLMMVRQLRHPNGHTSQHSYQRAYWLCMLPLLTTLVITALFSLHWRMLQDAPLLMYIAFLIDQYHALPYRDIFDQNMPGALAVYRLVGWLFGYGDLGFRIADLCVLSLLMLCTWYWCRAINRWYALAAPTLFALLYLNYGPSLSMQRDYILLLPIAAGMAVSTLRWDQKLRAFILGTLFGAATTIKPQALIGLPVLLLFLLSEPEPVRQRGAHSMPLLSAALGVSLPIAGCVLYLFAYGIIGDFSDMALHYLPLFAQITGLHEIISGAARNWYLLNGLLTFNHQYIWLVTALIGSTIALRWAGLMSPQRRQIFTMLGMLLCYSLYTLAQGRFWDYHWLPCLYFLALLSALCVLPQAKPAWFAQQVAPLLLLLLAVALRISLPVELSYQASGHRLPAIKNGRVDQISAFLKQNLRPGATVQPLDWTGGALQGMLEARARVATPFIYYFQFTHHLSSPYIQHLRQRFIGDLAQAQPQFIIDMGEYNTVITGADTSAAFPELQAILARDYTIVWNNNEYIIYQRK